MNGFYSIEFIVIPDRHRFISQEAIKPMKNWLNDFEFHQDMFGYSFIYANLHIVITYNGTIGLFVVLSNTGLLRDLSLCMAWTKKVLKVLDIDNYDMKVKIIRKEE